MNEGVNIKEKFTISKATVLDNVGDQMTELRCIIGEAQGMNNSQLMSNSTDEER